MHEQALKTEGIGQQTQPQKMAVQPGKFTPNRTQIFCAVRHLNIHDVLHRLAVSHAVHEAANAADAFGDINIILKIPFFDQFFQSAVDKADGRNSFHDRFIFQDQVEMDRLRQHRVLRAERDHTSCRHFATPPLAYLNGVLLSRR